MAGDLNVLNALDVAKTQWYHFTALLLLKKVYGMTLTLMVGSSLASGLSFGHTPKGVIATLGFFSFWLGFGIGGDYPLSATIMSEYANKKTRGASIAAVFAMQGFGILVGGIVSLIVATAFDHLYKAPPYNVNAEASLVPEADCVWRIILMFGAIPAGLTFYWRMKMPETAWLPEFGECVQFLEELDLSNCRSLVSLPKSIDQMKSLRILNISGCSKALRQPGNMKKSEDLEELKLSGTSKKEVLPSIMHLKYLKRFSIRFGRMLGRHHISSTMMVPPISCFPLLEKLDLSYCDLNDESLPPEMGCLLYLRKLNLSVNNFTELPVSCIANLTDLRQLNLNSCASLKSMPKLPPNIKSERWDIAVCLVLENQPSASTWSLPIYVGRHLEPLEITRAAYLATNILFLCRVEEFRDPPLCAFLMGNESIHTNIPPHLKGDQNKFHVSFEAYGKFRKHKLKISKCGWRVIRKEDLQVRWDKTRSERDQDNGFDFDMPSTSSSSDLYKARVREIDNE
ncbi:hypothetical protein L6164_028963 [Bauhinia variegata]|uniref:Uncharacterized protein n=1 Tax=Bauhinia variegata TaxID=167791 RepID=A0ACB9L793_BAUVA|nr:hypothetical protein L6164_028963 [Bauhinia variegata]